ncbi:MAG: hypothetical protein ACYTKD_23660 [Planctomycetota bacterium]
MTFHAYEYCIHVQPVMARQAMQKASWIQGKRRKGPRSVSLTPPPSAHAATADFTTELTKITENVRP